MPVVNVVRPWIVGSQIQGVFLEVFDGMQEDTLAWIMPRKEERLQNKGITR